MEEVGTKARFRRAGMGQMACRWPAGAQSFLCPFLDRLQVDVLARNNMVLEKRRQSLPKQKDY